MKAQTIAIVSLSACTLFAVAQASNHGNAGAAMPNIDLLFAAASAATTTTTSAATTTTATTTAGENNAQAQAAERL